MRTMRLTITIPDDVSFGDLHLGRDTVTRAVSFEWAPVERVCSASSIDVDLFRRSPEDSVAGLIVAWYSEHLARGGEPDPVAEQLLAEVAAEDEYGPERVQPGGTGEPQ